MRQRSTISGGFGASVLNRRPRRLTASITGRLSYPSYFRPSLCFLCVLCALCGSPFPPLMPFSAVCMAGPDDALPHGPGLVLKGAGGAYFLAEPGELVIDVFKRDLRVDRPTELRAILVGPDRRVLAEKAIPSDAQAGENAPEGRGIRLKVNVPRKGVHGLNITIATDRYGQSAVWGFRTNCPKFWIETSRGHKDERHQEPIVLCDPDTPGDVCFIPRPGRLALDVSGLPERVKELAVYDAAGKELATLPVDEKGTASHAFGKEVPRGGSPWRLHLPARGATVEIDGITRWDPDDPYSDFSLWTTDVNAAFPLHEYRWLHLPCRETVYAGEGAIAGAHSFTVHNNGTEAATIDLALEFPESPWPATLSADSVTLAPDASANVDVRYEVPPRGEDRSVHLRATPRENAGFSTYSTLTVAARPAPKSGPVETPILIRPYVWEGEAYGNRPAYPIGSEVYFDLENRPFVREGSRLKSRGGEGWMTTDLNEAVTSWTPDRSAWAHGTPTGKVAFDRDNDVYLLSTSGSDAALLHSRDRGATFAGYVLPNESGSRSSFDIEQFSGHNTPDGPPPFIRVTLLRRDPDRIWRRLCRLELFVPAKDAAGRIDLGKPILLSEKCLGIAAHSGIPSSIVSCDGKVHIVWAEATDPEEEVPGTPARVVTCDATTKKLGEPVTVAYGPPANDVHNTPSITIDKGGVLHVLGGTHGRPFPYAHSLRPNDTASGWSEPVLAGDRLEQTYIGFVCLPDDSLYAVFRLWGRSEEPFPLSHHARLATQHKPAGIPWQPPRRLLVAAFSEYSVYYHRLTIDRHGRLFLSYQYWSTHWFYRNDRFHERRSVLMSADGGKTWRFAVDADFGAEPVVGPAPVQESAPYEASGQQ